MNYYALYLSTQKETVCTHARALPPVLGTTDLTMRLNGGQALEDVESLSSKALVHPHNDVQEQHARLWGMPVQVVAGAAFCAGKAGT